MKKMKNKIALFLSVVMIFSAFTVPVFATGPKLTAKKVIVNVNKSKTVTLKKAKKKVKWTVTKGKKVVKIKVIGKNKIKITGKKSGKATIKATYKKKNYYINVNVKKNKTKKVVSTSKIEKETTKNIDGNVVTNPEQTTKVTPTTKIPEIEVPTTKKNTVSETTTKKGTTTETTTKRKPHYEEYE